MSTTQQQTVTGAIFKAMPAIMGEVGAVAKGRKNLQQGYQFRGIDDIYNELQEHLAKHGVFSIPHVVSERHEERHSKSGGVNIYRILTIDYTFYAEDGSSLTARVIGEGMDSGDKAANKAMSVADKYALLQVFKIPTEDKKDPEEDSPEVKPRAAPSRDAPQVIRGQSAQPRSYEPFPEGDIPFEPVQVQRKSDEKVYEGLDSQRRWVAAKTREKYPMVSDHELDAIHTAMMGKSFKVFGQTVNRVLAIGGRDA
jgi:hypothetical protein